MANPDKPHGGPVRSVQIIFKETIVTDVVVGKTISFVVKGFNNGGNQVPISDANVTVSDASIATATVNPDGTNGVLTGVAKGTVTVNGVAAGITSAPVTINVLEDNTVVTVTIEFGV